MREYARRCAAYYAREYRLDPALVRAVIQVESAWNPGAVSSAGVLRYFLGGDPSTGTPQLAEERTSEVEAIAEAFRKQVNFFVVQEFTVDVQNHNGAPLLRKNPVKDRSSP